MKIEVKRTGVPDYVNVKITDSDTTIDLGLQNAQSAIELISELVGAADELLQFVKNSINR